VPGCVQADTLRTDAGTRSCSLGAGALLLQRRVCSLI
jgi:hypothetical protein